MSLSETTEHRRGPSPMMLVSVTIGTVVAVALITVVSVLTGGSSSSLFQRSFMDGKLLTVNANAQLGTSTNQMVGLNSATVKMPWANHHASVVVFFASWCEPCKEELPRVAEFASTHNLGSVRFLGINESDETAAGRAFVASAHVRFPVAIDDSTVTAGVFRLGNLPDTVFVNSDGTVDHVVIGKVTNEQLAIGISQLR